MIDRCVRCLATVSMGGTLYEKLEATAATGFQAVELFERDLLDSGEAPRPVARMVGDLGLQIEVYGPLRDVEGLADGDAHRESIARSERMLDVAVELGARTVLVCSNTSAAASDDAGRSASQLGLLADRAVERGLKIGFEALSWGTHVRTYGGAWNVVRRAGHPGLGLVVDTFHTSALKDDPAPIEQIPGDRIFLVQIADAPMADCDIVWWSRHLRCFPGEGVFPVAAMLRHVMQAGYCGPLSLEIFSDRVSRAAPHQSARQAMQSLLRLERELAADIGPEGSLAFS